MLYDILNQRLWKYLEQSLYVQRISDWTNSNAPTAIDYALHNLRDKLSELDNQKKK